MGARAEQGTLTVMATEQEMSLRTQGAGRLGRAEVRACWAIQFEPTERRMGLWWKSLKERLLISNESTRGTGCWLLPEVWTAPTTLQSCKACPRFRPTTGSEHANHSYNSIQHHLANTKRLRRADNSLLGAATTPVSIQQFHGRPKVCSWAERGVDVARLSPDARI